MILILLLTNSNCQYIGQSLGIIGTGALLIRSHKIIKSLMLKHKIKLKSISSIQIFNKNNTFLSKQGSFNIICNHLLISAICACVL